MTLADHAVGYAEDGYLVFPVDPETKAPIGDLARHGAKDATDDEDTVAHWWQARPDALIGCRIPEHLVVLDVDPRHGGLTFWEAIGADQLPNRRHYSGRNDGGVHVWFEHPGGKLTAAGMNEWATDHGIGEKAGVDILHHRHRYTILPPSPHPDTGEPYHWEDEQAPILPMPEWLAELVVAPEPAPTPPPAQRTEYVGESVADWFSTTKTWNEILGPHGWTVVSGDGQRDGSKWRHPEATAASSASVSHGTLFVYSPNTPFEETQEGAPRGYTPFAAYATLYHGGDQSAAARRALEMPGAPVASAPDIEKIVLGGGKLELEQQPEPFEHLLKRIYRGREVDHIPPPTWLVPELFEHDSLAMLYGPSGSGKSFMAMHWALCVATGTDYFGRSVEARPVIYIAGEGGAGIAQRQDAWLTHFEVDDASDLHWHHGAINLLDVPQVVEMASYAAHIKAGLIVVDTLHRCSVGFEESSAKEAGQVIEALDILRGSGDRPCVLAVHHSGKDATKGARGSSALRGAMETEVELTGDAVLKRVRVTKQKNAPEPEHPWNYTLTDVAESVVLTSSNLRSATQDTREAILAVLNEVRGGSGLTRGDIHTAVVERLGQRDPGTTNRAISALQGEGLVTQGGRGAFLSLEEH